MSTDNPTDPFQLLHNNTQDTNAESAEAEADAEVEAESEVTLTTLTASLSNHIGHRVDSNEDISETLNDDGGDARDSSSFHDAKIRSPSNQANVLTAHVITRRDSSSDSSHASCNTNNSCTENPVRPNTTTTIATNKTTTTNNNNNDNCCTENPVRPNTTTTTTTNKTTTTKNNNNNDNMDEDDVRFGRHNFRKQKTESLLDLNGRHLHGLLTRTSSTSTSVRSSMNDVNSTGSCSPRMTSRETTTSRKRWEINHQSHRHQATTIDPTGYQTPLQRRERETRLLKSEVNSLQQENERNEAEVALLRSEMEERLKAKEEEMEQKVSHLEQKLLESQEKGREATENSASLKEELYKMDALYTENKHQLQQKDEMFNQCYLDMYLKGQQAAAFEREEELAILANKKHPKITVRELARKLSKTELELARWQTLRLNEAYSTTDSPSGQADVTLSFLKDSFYHFVCDPHDSLSHFRAMLEIFKYSDSQMAQIKKSVDESKAFHKLLRKE